MQDGKSFRTGIAGQPEPQDLCGAAQPGAPFVQLDIRQLELTEKMRVQAVRVLPCAGRPGDDRRLPVALRPARLRKGPGLRTEQIGPWRAFCAGVFSRYTGVWRRALNLLWQAGPRIVWIREAVPCLPSPKSRVDLSVCDPAVCALWGRTSEAVGLHPSGVLPGGFFPHARDVTSAGAGLTADEGAQGRRQAGQSRGMRGFLRRRWTMGCAVFAARCQKP